MRKFVSSSLYNVHACSFIWCNLATLASGVSSWRIEGRRNGIIDRHYKHRAATKATGNTAQWLCMYLHCCTHTSRTHNTDIRCICLPSHSNVSWEHCGLSLITSVIVLSSATMSAIHTVEVKPIHILSCLLTVLPENQPGRTTMHYITTLTDLPTTPAIKPYRRPAGWMVYLELYMQHEKIIAQGFSLPTHGSVTHHLLTT